MKTIDSEFKVNYDSETNNNINISIINTIKQDKDTSRLLKRRHLKGKKVVILKDMARDLAKRLTEEAEGKTLSRLSLVYQWEN